jgi:hypothetical protein
MQFITRLMRNRVTATGLLLLCLTAIPGLSVAQTVTGQAAALRANILGTTSLLGVTSPSVNTALADTGSLSGTGDMLQASLMTGSIPSVVTAEVLHAVTASSDDGVISQTSLSNIGLTVAGNDIGIGFAMASAQAPTNSAASGQSSVEGLLINGTPVAITGQPNQVVPLLGGEIIVNEQKASSDGTMVVNALHVIISGVADIIVATASAGTGSQTTSSSGGLLSPFLGTSGAVSLLSSRMVAQRNRIYPFGVDQADQLTARKCRWIREPAQA